MSTLVLAILITGCSNTIGTKMTKSQMDQVASGRTTSADLVALFGEPTRIIKNSDGTQDLEWGYAKAGFAGIGNEMQGVSFAMGKDGTVKSYKSEGIFPESK
jgi:hypothetical protein